MQGWLRLAASAAVATALLALVITVGARFLERLPAPEPPESEIPAPAATAQPGDAGLTLSLSGERSPVRISEREVALLREFLAESPGARLRRALAESDLRWLGVNGRSVDVPGAEDPERVLREDRVLLIPGTSDRSISDEHEELIERSRRYARAYNALLSQRSSPRADD